MSQKLHLQGEIESPDGKAPEAAWRSVEGRVRRPKDVWVEGDPRTLVKHPERWKSRLDVPEEAVGLRARFVLHATPPDAFHFIKMVGELLPVLEDAEGGLFFHAEVMEGPEPGIYFAYENRVPALLTQMHMGEGGVEGTLDPMPRGPVHVNILLHDQSKGFAEACTDGTLKMALDHMIRLSNGALDMKFIHELTLARSDAHGAGVSAGIEAVRQEQGAQGGFTAGQTGSRARPGGDAALDTPPASGES